jgi:hypothetical protein
MHVATGRTLGAAPAASHQHRSERPVLLAVDQQFGEGAALGLAPELADPVGAVEVREHEGGLLRRLRAMPIPLGCEAISTSGGVTGDGGVLEDLDNSSAFDPHRRAWRTA